GERQLVAYLTARGGERLETEALRRFLHDRLPDPLVPRAYLVLDALPLGPSGKVDRRALSRLAVTPAEPAASGAGAGGAPPTPVEELLAAMWAEQLGVERVGGDDDFFELGGHSLLATRALSRVRDALGVELELRDLFDAPTVRRLAARIESDLRQRSGVPPAPEVARVRDAPPPGGARRAPLSFSQERLWFLDRLHPGSRVYNLPYTIDLRGALDARALAASLGAIVRRHEALRTTFEEAGGEPVQSVAAVSPLTLARIDLSALGEPARHQETERLTRDEARRPFDLRRGPLLRTALLEVGERDGAAEHRLFLSLHHIIADGWSLGVLTSEIAALYADFAAGRGPSLPELPVQYGDFAGWQRDRLVGERLEAQVAYWRERLAGAPPDLALPFDRPRPAVQTSRGDLRPFAISAAATTATTRLGRRQGATRFMVLYAAYVALLERYTAQGRLLVGTPVANRNRTEIEGLIGFFVNTLVLAADLTDDPSFRDLLDRTRDGALAAYAHQELPFEKLVEALAPERDLSRNPLVQTFFSLQGRVRPALAMGAGLAARVHETPAGSAKFDLSLFVEEQGDGLAGIVEHATDLLDGTTVERLIRHYLAILEAVIAEPDVPVSELPLLASAERQQLREWSGGARFASGTTVDRLFAEQAARDPEATAVEGDGWSLSYGELARRA
ncbi:MAG TPA: condensation domain-containing protein, partial [Thermoanaerobaculia bacterium]